MARFKTLSFTHKVVYLLNILFALLLIFAYILPFIPPKLSSTLSILNLGLGLFILCNVIFTIYWLVVWKRQMILSLACLLVGFGYWDSIYALNSNKGLTKSSTETLNLLSYNVRLFNAYKWTNDKEIPHKIKQFIHQEKPDILALQDYYINRETHLQDFKFSYKQPRSEPNGKFGLAIYSRYKIINTHNLRFEETGNNAIYADIVVDQDTLRVFSIHLESLKIKPDVKQFQNQNQQQLLNRIGKSFIKQQTQAEQLAHEIKLSPYKVIVCGDLNNSAVSYVSQLILGDRLKDSFEEAGSGFGKTFDFDFIPLRIDVIYIDKQLKAVEFKNYKFKYSDHYPISTEVVI